MPRTNFSHRTDSPYEEIIIKPTNPESNIGAYPSVRLTSGIAITIREGTKIPSDFRALDRADVIVVSPVSGDIIWNTTVNYGKVGSESYLNASGVILSGSTTLQMNIPQKLSFHSSILGIEAEDQMGIQFTRLSGDGLASDCHYLGMAIRYKW